MSCVACDGRTTQRTIGTGELLVCVRCGSATLASIPPHTDYWGSSVDHVSTFWTDVKARYFSSALALLEEQLEGRRLLDIGGGVGHFAALAVDRGWDAISLDVSPAATEQASRLLGPERAVGHLDQVPDAGFDVVTMWCVVAHVPDPRDLLSGSVAKLAPGGALWLTTPNFNFQRRYAAIRARMGKPIDFASDDHINHFTPQGLQRLGDRAGLREWRWHYRGITEFCAMSSSGNPALLAGKRSWNRGAWALMRAGGPNITSELQGLALAAGAG